MLQEHLHKWILKHKVKLGGNVSKLDDSLEDVRYMIRQLFSQEMLG